VTFTRRQFINSSTVVLAGTAFSRLGLAQSPSPGAQAPAAQAPQAPAPTVTKFEDVRRNVGIFSGRGGTIGYLITPDGAIAVDAQFPDTAKACVEGLQQKAPKGIQMLINTHYHGDHTGGNSAFRPAVKSIVQQERCAKLHKEFTAKNNTAAQQAYADLTFGESWSTNIGDEKVWAHYYGPGHTGGDAVIFFEKANVVHMGDLMFNRLHPRVDRPSGASIKNWGSVLERVAKKHRDATFIFGHAKQGLPVTGSSKELLQLRDYFTAVLDHAQKGIRAGQSQEQIVGVESLPKFEDYASSGQVLNLKGTLTAAYEELTSKTE
jgi:glyoxylase-like metal-dependent hydrolase (beta-lactamase superfamily II)